MNENELLEIISIFGKKLLYYGAEVYRADECIKRICAAYGYGEVDVFAIPCTVIVTVRGIDGSPRTVSADIGRRSPDLDKAGEYMNLCRKICKKKPSFDEIKKETERIENRKVYSEKVRAMSLMAVGASFVFYFGGDIKTAVFGALLGGVVYFLSSFIKDTGSGVFLTDLICSAVIAFLSVSLFRLGLIAAYDKLIISVLMTLVPGVSITNGMRDFFRGDLLAGLYMTAESFTAAVSLAIGAGAVIAAYG